MFKLYGEQSGWPTPDLLHCESIAARSRLHDWRIRPHSHGGLFQLLLLQQGSARVRFDDREETMHGGQLALVPQLCVHGFRFEADAVGWVVTLAYPLIARLGTEAETFVAALARPGVFDCGDEREQAYFDAAFAELNAEYCSQAHGRTAVLENLLQGIFLRLARRLQARAGAEPARGQAMRHLGRFMRLIDAHYAEHRPLSFYAGQLGLSAAHLNAVCRQGADKSALELIHERLLLEARRSLVYSGSTVAVVADKLGFADAAYFTRFFRRHAGMSPKAFRQAYLARRDQQLP